MRSIKYALADLKLAVIGYKAGNEPDWLRLKQLASVQARVEESDERALAVIAGEVRSHPKAAIEARRRLTPRISCYEADRAVRLIDAAMSGMPVRPISPECVELFEQEATLGRMPLQEAFAEAASRVPELEHIKQRLYERYEASRASIAEGTGRSSSSAEYAMRRDAQREIAQIIGPQSRHPDPLLRSYLPRNIAYCWLAIVCGNPRGLDPGASYFSLSDVRRVRGK